MQRFGTIGAALLAATFATASLSAQTAGAPAQGGEQTQAKPEQQKPAEKEETIFEEQVVVTASRVEQQLVNAPATVSVVRSDVIQSSPATNYAELLRSVPGMNVTQTSARDFNLNMRGASSTLATSQLALIDGRSLYLDFFGFVAWDFLPVNPNELRQIEVVRGPASAVWGANAMTGVVNFITKTPREMAGDTFTFGVGTFNRNVTGRDQAAGSIWYMNGTHARAVNDRWSYKLSAGTFSQEAMPRPFGTINNPAKTPYPDFVNQGTQQPKFDARVDYEAENGGRLSVSGGVAGTEGIIHTGIGPFDMARGTLLGYSQLLYTKGALRINAFSNVLDGDATSLLTVGPTGRPILFLFNTKTYDVNFGNVTTLGSKNVVSYGGNYRYQGFDLSIAPRGNDRTEFGFYLQDEIFLNEHVRLVLGGRADKFSILDGVKFNPRTALILKPSQDHSVRLSYNRAFRAPSLINNFLDTKVVNQLNLGLINPAFAGRAFNFVSDAIGNEDLEEEKLQAMEIAYTGQIRNRATVSAAFYYNTARDGIYFTQTARYRATNPPAGWLQTLALLPPQQALGVLEVLPPACASLASPCTTGGLPSKFSYLNLGKVIDKGIELGFDVAASKALNLFANYSYQFQPDPDFDLSEVNLPPTNRVNAGFSYSQGRFTANGNVSYQDKAYWQDVLDSRFHGETDAFTQVNAAMGLRWLNGKVTTTIKGSNLFDQEIQSHVFGDVMRRQVIGEMRVSF